MVFKLALLVGLPACIRAVRDESDIDLDSSETWLGKSDVWCASTGHSIACDDDSVIHVRSAFFNKQKRSSCKPLRPGREPGCGENVTDKVTEVCEKKNRCTLSASNHACAKKPYTLIRVVWDCVGGDSPAESAPRQRMKQPANQLTPCYWQTRTHMITTSFNFFGRMTSCNGDEGCFKVSLPHGNVFSDPEAPPSEEDLLKGKLVTGEDSSWVTWQGTGLVRNDHNTWGVCLPKEEGPEHAISFFNRLKASRR
mmetsp:Transcript_105917/g.294734  ORF Transcript_105917/g.294734 Transcript_105917/m.294734 type:complete len:253 (+) Transcript_105917:78-836(+)